MAKIRNAKPKTSSGGYYRLFNDQKRADICVKIQSTVISSGTELEKLIVQQANLIKNLDCFLDSLEMNQTDIGSYLCTKKVLKTSSYKLSGHEPDFLIFVIQQNLKTCYIVELKDGDMFDTKKSQSERDMLIQFCNHIAPLLSCKTRYAVCSFNQCDKAKIVKGFKGVFTEAEVMTGVEFCRLLNIDYTLIVVTRESDAVDNRDYVDESFAEILEIQQKVQERQRIHISEEEFYKVLPLNF